jgi:hypothetical protein
MNVQYRYDVSLPRMGRALAPAVGVHPLATRTRGSAPKTAPVAGVSPLPRLGAPPGSPEKPY